jgi:hypothetical protein
MTPQGRPAAGPVSDNGSRIGDDARGNRPPDLIDVRGWDPQAPRAPGICDRQGGEPSLQGRRLAPHNEFMRGDGVTRVADGLARPTADFVKSPRRDTPGSQTPCAKRPPGAPGHGRPAPSHPPTLAPSTRSPPGLRHRRATCPHDRRGRTPQHAARPPRLGGQRLPPSRGGRRGVSGGRRFRRWPVSRGCPGRRRRGPGGAASDRRPPAPGAVAPEFGRRVRRRARGPRPDVAQPNNRDQQVPKLHIDVVASIEVSHRGVQLAAPTRACATAERLPSPSPAPWKRSNSDWTWAWQWVGRGRGRRQERAGRS